MKLFKILLNLYSFNSVQSAFQRFGFNLTKFQIQIFNYLNRGGGVCSFLKNTYLYKFRKDLQVNSKSFQCLCAEVENKNSKDIVLNLVYRPPNGDHKELEYYFKGFLSKRKISHKDRTLAGDFNTYLLDFDANKKIKVL